MLDSEGTVLGADDDGEDVELGRHHDVELEDVGFRRRDGVAHLRPVHRLRWSEEEVVPSGPHLHDHQGAILFRHDVQFQLAASPVAMPDLVPFRRKVFHCFFFA